jgi:hypothetical protein
MSDDDSKLAKLVCDKVANSLDFGICVLSRETNMVVFKNQMTDQIHKNEVNDLDSIFTKSEIDLMQISPSGNLVQTINGIHYTTTYEIDDNYVFITTKKNCKDHYIIEQLMNIKKDIKEIVNEM